MNYSNDELITGIKNGAEAAFKFLFDSFHLKLYAVARKMGMSNDEAEDVIQDSFLQLWKQRDKINDELSLHGLLYTIAKRIVLKRLEENRRCYTVDYTEVSIPTEVNQTQDDIYFSETSNCINEAINTLPEQQRLVFSLNLKNGLSPYEISEQLDVSKRTVENQIFRARKILKAALIKNGILSFIFALICNLR